MEKLLICVGFFILAGVILCVIGLIIAIVEAINRHKEDPHRKRKWIQSGRGFCTNNDYDFIGETFFTDEERARWTREEAATKPTN